MSARPLVCAALALAVSACAPAIETSSADGAAASGARQCFYANQVRNFRSAGMTTVYLRGSDNAVYEVNAAGGCRDLDFTTSLAITSDTAGAVSERLCVGDSARIIVPNSMQGACRVRISRQLTAEEVAALPSTQRP